MRSKTILMLLESNFIEDERVKKECIVLSDNGFEIHVLFPQFKNQVVSKDTFEYPSVYMHPFEVEKSIFNKMLGTCLIFPFYFNFWLKKADQLIKTFSSIDCLYIHDLPLAKVGVRLKKKYNSILICDQHEFYSDWIVRAKHMNTFTGKIVKRLSDWKKYEKTSLLKSDLVVTVTPELVDKYVQENTIDSNKIISLPNTPMKQFYQNETLLDISVIEKYKNNSGNRVIYVGANLSFERGLNLMIDAIPLIINKIPNFRFMILGKPHSSYDIVKHIKENHVEKYVELIGMVPNNLIPSYLHCSSIGVNLHDPHSEEINNTIPTKIYQYVAINLAVISSDCKLITKFINETNIGAIVDHNAIDLANKIIDLLSDTKLLAVKKENTKNIQSMFWEETSVNWIEKVNELFKQ